MEKLQTKMKILANKSSFELGLKQLWRDKIGVIVPKRS